MARSPRDLSFYNEELKLEFINEKLSEANMSRTYLDLLFDAACVHEKQLGKDICNFTVDEILTFYKSCNRRSSESIAVMNSILNQYTIFCLKKNLVADSQNHFSNITRDLYSTCVNTAFQKLAYISEETLNSWLNQTVNYCDKFFILGLFEGLSGNNLSELFYAKVSDITDGKISLCTGSSIPISQKLITIAEEAGKEMYYYTLGDKMDLKRKFVEEDDTILKNYPNIKLDVSEFQKGRRLYVKFKRLMSIYGYPYLNTKNVIDSGKIAFINRRCKELNISGHEFLFTDHIKEIDQQFGGTCVRSVFDRTYGEYLVK